MHNNRIYLTNAHTNEVTVSFAVPDHAFAAIFNESSDIVHITTTKDYLAYPGYHGWHMVLCTTSSEPELNAENLPQYICDYYQNDVSADRVQVATFAEMPVAYCIQSRNDARYPHHDLDAFILLPSKEVIDFGITVFFDGKSADQNEQRTKEIFQSDFVQSILNSIRAEN